MGTELTEGTIQDAHLQYFGRELSRIGLELTACVHTPDRRELFLRELERAAVPQEADIEREVRAILAGRY